MKLNEELIEFKYVINTGTNDNEVFQELTGKIFLDGYGDVVLEIIEGNGLHKLIAAGNSLGTSGGYRGSDIVNKIFSNLLNKRGIKTPY